MRVFGDGVKLRYTDVAKFLVIIIIRAIWKERPLAQIRKRLFPKTRNLPLRKVNRISDLVLSVSRFERAVVCPPLYTQIRILLPRTPNGAIFE